ncbi:TnsD family Tn7-like transposition protein [Clostridium perfringens]|uniref:TnsD family Tn7-like transposition protein n=1 Tax=Clostridium perfringens TaxID=1502 RepID=UPI0024BC83B5|nr:TnsD family Tn7-like transposition protein [Clostridium perfringens]
MINLLPKVYDDELLYSIIARYRRRCGLINKRSLIRDFGVDNKIFMRIDINFPVNIKSFVESLPKPNIWTEERVIKGNTMYPIYTKFLDGNRSEEIFRSMISNDKRQIYLMAGLGRSTVNFNKYLRYCPYCVEEDLKLYGESYWRRIHQVVGKFLCNKHKCKLVDSNVLANNNNIDYICVDDIYNKENIKLCNNLDILILDKKYSDFIKYLSNNPDKRLNIEEIKSFYKNKFFEKGLTSKNGSLNLKEIEQQIKGFYSKEYLSIMQSNFQLNDINNWVRLFLRNNKSKSIVRHFLMLNFLGTNVNEMFEYNYEEVYEFKKVYKKYNNIFDIELKRKEWLRVLKKNPNKSKSELKSIGKGLYSYLYMHDRAWFNEITPTKKVKNKRKIENYDYKEAFYCNLVRQAVTNMKSKEGMPQKITISAIKREIGIATINRKNFKKVYRLMKELSETTDEFRVRRVKWGIKELGKKNSKISINSIKVITGLTHLDIEYLEDVLKSIFSCL